MNSSVSSYYNKPFSHIYVEREILEHPRTKQILSRFPQSRIVEVGHYKDVFSAPHQAVGRQHRAQSLILAAKHGQLIYHGSPVCQDFGNEFFYYTSCVMNCIYDCEYCYLKGMYESGHMVIFVNLEDYFTELRSMLQEHPVYLCISYDTDLAALEGVTGYLREWIAFALEEPNLTIEVRTKCASMELWEKLPVCDRMIYAFTISPREIAARIEHFAPASGLRLKAASAALDLGHRVRLCFDPMLHVPDWKEKYADLVTEAAETLDLEKLYDVSVGCFRISKSYLKHMRKADPRSAVVQYPYTLEEGFYSYPGSMRREMEDYMCDLLYAYMDRKKIYLVEEREDL